VRFKSTDKLLKGLIFYRYRIYKIMSTFTL